MQLPDNTTQVTILQEHIGHIAWILLFAENNFLLLAYNSTDTDASMKNILTFLSTFKSSLQTQSNNKTVN